MPPPAPAAAGAAGGEAPSVPGAVLCRTQDRGAPKLLSSSSSVTYPQVPPRRRRTRRDGRQLSREEGGCGQVTGGREAGSRAAGRGGGLKGGEITGGGGFRRGSGRKKSGFLASGRREAAPRGAPGVSGLGWARGRRLLGLTKGVPKGLEASGHLGQLPGPGPRRSSTCGGRRRPPPRPAASRGRFPGGGRPAEPPSDRPGRAPRYLRSAAGAR